MKFSFALLFLGLARAQLDGDAPAFSGPNFQFSCPEPNGLFADSEQCDLYYTCEDGVSLPALCDDGMLFDDSIRNREKCVLPHGVDCGSREFVQEPTPGIDERCPRANGLFDHPSDGVCDKYILCDKGTAHEMPCSPPLVFDSVIGACVLEDQLSLDAKSCSQFDEDGGIALKSIDGFTCSGKEEIGPLGLLQTHPVYAHPTDCQYFFTCFFGKEPNKFGCPKGQVFDADNLVCKEAEEVSECACWYDCGDNSSCPDSCNADCSCPSK